MEETRKHMLKGVVLALIGAVAVFTVIHLKHGETNTLSETELRTKEVNCVKHVKLIHTTDIHGWVMGHRHIPELDADAADFLSLTTHLKDQAESSNAFDFFLFDSGDLIEGTGLSDATPMHGTYVYPVITQLPYTALSPGNHDLGQNNVIQYLHQNFTQFWGEKYISTNVYWSQTGEPLGGSRVLKVKTPNGLNALVFGIIFDFSQAGSLATVQSIEDLVNTTFFQDNLNNVDDVDIVFAVGHYPPGGSEQTLIHGAIRQYAPDIPLIMLAGHTHELFFGQVDDNSYIVQSDHYFYHIGHVEFDLDVKAKKIINLSCEFVNTSSSEFIRLSGMSADTFLTPKAAQLRQTMTSEFDALDLDTQFGCSPAFYSAENDWSVPTSLYYQLVNRAMPDILYANQPNVQFISIVHTSLLRSDMYAGPVIEDDLLSMIPFNDVWQEHAGISGSDFQQFLTALGDTSPDITLYLGNEKWTNEYHHRRIHHRTRARKLTALDTPGINQWAKSLNYLNIDPSQSYTLVTDGYDSVHFHKILESLFGDKYPQTEFNTTLAPRDTLGAFVSKDFACTSI